jgi:hypothetical protein
VGEWERVFFGLLSLIPWLNGCGALIRFGFWFGAGYLKMMVAA